MPSTLVWDWNGTLFGDADAMIASTVDAFAAAGLPPVTAERYRALHVQPIPHFYDRLAGRTLAPAEQRALATAHLAAHLTTLGADPAGAVLIGDSADDARAAAEVGARCVLYASGLHDEAALTATGAPVTTTLATAVTTALDLP